MKDTGVEVHAGEGLQVCRYMQVNDTGVEVHSGEE